MKISDAERILRLASAVDPQLHGIVELALIIGVMPCDVPPITAQALADRRLTLPGGRVVVLGTASLPVAARLDLPHGAPGGAMLDARWRRLARTLGIESETINDVVVLVLERELDEPLPIAPLDGNDEVPF